MKSNANGANATNADAIVTVIEDDVAPEAAAVVATALEARSTVDEQTTNFDLGLKKATYLAFFLF